MVREALDPRGRIRLAVLAAVGLAAGALLGAAFPDPGAAAVLAPVLAAALAVLLPVAQVLDWRGLGGRSWSLAVHRTVRSGVLPEGADPREWVPRLERFERELGRERWRWLVLALPLVLSLRDADSRTPAWWVVVGLGLAIALAGSARAWITRPRVRRRVEALVRPLETQWADELRARSS